MIYVKKIGELFGKRNPSVRGSSKPLIFLLACLLLISVVSPILTAEEPGLRSNDYGREPMDEAYEALESDENVTVTQKQDDLDRIIFDPVDKDPSVGVAFSAGGDVDPRAYAPPIREIAEEGYFVVLFSSGAGMPDGGPFGEVIDYYPDIEEWSVGGHSNGGVDAADYFNNQEPAGLHLWASYPSGGFIGIGKDDLSDKEGEFVSIYGTNDGVTTVDDIEDSKSRLPEDTEYVEIEGGNHTQFAWYRNQEDDNPASIPREEQQDITTDAVIEHLNAIRGVPEYDLTINSENGGTTDPAPGTYTHTEGQEVTVEAIPDDGYVFEQWTGDHTSTDPTTTVTMNENKNITAEFKEEPEEEYDLTMNIEGEGSTTPAEGTHTYTEGEQVTITATPDEGYYFENWTGDHTGTEEEITITMNEDKSITAHFLLDTTDPTADAGEDKTVGAGTVVTFDGSGSSDNVGIENYTWTIEDSEYYGETVEHEFTQPGEYSVELKVTDEAGNSDTDTAVVTVENSPPTASFSYSPTDVTVGETVEFTDESTDDDGSIESWSWDFDDGSESTEQNPTHSYESSGTYTVNLTVEDDGGKTDSYTEDITVQEGEYPQVEGGDTSYDEYITNVQFNGIDKDSGNDDGYADHTDSVSDPVEPGQTYQLSVTISTGDYTDYVSVAIDWDHDYEFSDEQVIEVGSGGSNPLTVTKEITVPDDAAESETRMRVMQEYEGYHKDPASNQDYGETEDYTVQIGSVEPSLEADFSYEPAVPEEGDDVQFTDESSCTGGQIVDWSWDFGDGATSTEQNPTHTYDQKGNYTVELKVSADNGLEDTATETITVEENIVVGPEADFSYTPNEPEEGDTVEFSDQSTEGDAAITGWSWDFDDGDTSTEQNPTHTYDQKGNYTVELKVTDDNDLSDSVTKTITVKEITGEYCEVSGGDTSYDEYMTNVQFNGINKDSGDDGGYADHTDSVSNSLEPGQSYELSVTLNTGGYSEYVTVVIDWDQDYELSDNQVIEVGSGNSDPLTVTKEITVPDDASEGETRMRVMQEYEEYHKQPCEDQGYGETEDYTVQIGSVEPSLEADFSYEPAVPEEGDDVQFTDESTCTGGQIVDWSWDFGDGATSTEQNPTHTYDQKGNYTVELKVSADNGLEDTATDTITVEENIVVGPEADFSFSPTEPEEGDTVEFSDQSTEGDAAIVYRSWNFGDGNTSTEQNPSHVYDQKGNYTVKLNVTDDNDLSDTVTKTITVKEITGEYCEVSGGDTSYDEYITNVQFNGIDKDSGDDGGYADHTSSVSNSLEPGQSYELSVTLNTGGYSEYVTVVIDWDQDYELSDNQVIEVGSGNSDPLTVKKEITVPEDASTGETRMRVMQEYEEYHKQPCEDQSYGETEDYTLKIDTSQQSLEEEFSNEPEIAAGNEDDIERGYPNSATATTHPMVDTEVPLTQKLIQR